MQMNQAVFQSVRFPRGSHKGENGKVLVIADSDLFYAPGLWAAELLAHFVDMVFYYPPSPNHEKGFERALRRFKNGIVIHDLSRYIDESDVILMGPGMRRDSEETSRFINNTLKTRNNKKWVLDAGALQVMDPHAITDTMILTPHQQELRRFGPSPAVASKTYPGTWLAKNHHGVDGVFKAGEELWRIEGGNTGLTKGGTGDLLAALTAFFYICNEAPLSCAAASLCVKTAADCLWKETGPYFTTTELLHALPGHVWRLQSQA